MEKQSRKQYQKPAVEDWGTVTELTATGQTQSGPDAKGGSVTGNQGQ